MSAALLWLLACRPQVIVEGDRLLATESGEAPTNLLILSIDTLRKDAFARYGGDGDLDFLDGILAEGVTLDRHRSCANWTLSSFTCAFAGQLDLDLGFHVWSRDDAVANLPLTLDILPDWFERQGYGTGLVSASKVYGGDDALTADFDLVVLSHDARADFVVDEGLEVLDELREHGDPWLLQLHTFDPHSPYSPAEGYRDALDALEPLPWDLDEVGGLGGLSDAWATLEGSDRELVLAHLDARYSGEIALVDDQLARLWQGLGDRGVLDDTLVWVFTDHGEQFYEHNGLTHDRSGHREEVDAVSFFWARDLAPRAWTRPTSQVDLAPTVADLFGVPLPADLRGRVLTEQVEDAPIHTFRYLSPEPVIHAVELDGDRLIYKWDGLARVYDAVADPTEQAPAWDPAEPRHAALWDEMLPLVEAAETLIPHLTRTPPPSEAR